MKKRSNARLQRQSKKETRHRARRQAKPPVTGAAKSRGQTVVCELLKTIEHFFPDLLERLRQLEDCRRKSDYALSELLMAGIALFVFQQGSRNALNNQRQEAKFKKHYQRLFKLRLPHLDTVHRVLCRLVDEQLERLKQGLVKTLLEKKVLHPYRLLQRYFVVAIDATGTLSFAEKHCAQCLHQTSKTGKTRYFHQVLEAKLITPNGFAISLATEWIANPVGAYDKQDCERNAFVRLAAKLKQCYPRLPICLTADGLYPYQGFFEQYHRLIKQVCHIEKFQVRGKVPILNHIFAALCSYVHLQQMQIADVISNAYCWQRDLYKDVVAAFVRTFIVGKEYLNPQLQTAVNA
jgi:hypothetical protein